MVHSWAKTAYTVCVCACALRQVSSLIEVKSWVGPAARPRVCNARPGAVACSDHVFRWEDERAADAPPTAPGAPVAPAIASAAPVAPVAPTVPGAPRPGTSIVLAAAPSAPSATHDAYGWASPLLAAILRELDGTPSSWQKGSYGSHARGFLPRPQRALIDRPLTTVAAVLAVDLGAMRSGQYDLTRGRDKKCLPSCPRSAVLTVTTLVWFIFGSHTHSLRKTKRRLIP